MLMIRILFLLLLIANIGIFVHNRGNTPAQQTFKAVDPNVDKLVLLKELENQNTIWEEEINNQNSDAIDQLCYSVGPFTKKSKLQTTYDQIKSKVLKIKSRELVSSQEAGYWVYIPALKSRNDALAIARQLSAYDVKDYYVVTSGQHENTVSLGVYRSSDNADSRMQELSSRGFKPVKEVRIEQWPEFWLDFSIQSENSESYQQELINEFKLTSNQVVCNW